MKSKHVRLVIEIVAWFIFIVFPDILYSSFQPVFSMGTLRPVFKGILITHSYLIGFYYFNCYYAIPKFLFAKKYPAYALVMLSCLLVIILFLQTDRNYNPLAGEPFRHYNLIFIFSVFIRFFMIFLLSLGVVSYDRLKQTEEEKLKAELSYLKAQINPHFLFNTLNSIYALTVKKSDAAPESVTKLSAIMRYVISESAQEFVPLDKEMNYVSSYIELEKLRITPKVSLSYGFPGDTAGKQIAPLIFIPFIENAFKYGVSTSGDSVIVISMALCGGELKLHVKNTKSANRPPSRQNTRLGIETTRKRLKLLYPAKHTLIINDLEKEFIVDLTLQLS
ncbi:MAG: sensor histidine kinase [Bacteroidia bacterium]